MIIFPMAGLSKRFTKAGYAQPKYMLIGKGKTLFHHSVMSFKKYFGSEKFVFVALNRYNTKLFIINECKKMGLTDYEIVLLEKPTNGQAETVYLAIERLNVDEEETLLIFNIDTFRPNFSWPKEFDILDTDGYLETFIGSGSNWSNVLPGDNVRQTVSLTAEKQQISEYCCTGIYFWRRSGDYRRIYKKHFYEISNDSANNEFYIAPMYNDLIMEGSIVHYSIIPNDDVIFCGVPEEYETFCGVT